MTVTVTATMRHGFNSTYSAGCRCDECREARRVHAAKTRSRKPPGRIDAAPARAHVKALQARGMTLKAIGEAARVYPQTVSNIARPGGARVLRRTAEALLAVPLPPAPGAEPDEHGRVDISPVRARIRALRGRHWSYAEIAEAAGVTVYAVSNITQHRPNRPMHRVQESTASAILAVPLGPSPSQLNPQEPDAKTLADRANLDAFMARIRRGRRAA